jgi:hypothetical protein
MLSLLVLFLAHCGSTEIYTSATGAQTNLCHILSPCSFTKAVLLVSMGDIVFVKGSYIEDPTELEQLRILFNAALAEGAVVMSNNMTVNGSRYSSVGQSFIVVQSAADSRIHKFHFTGFRTTIACFRTVEKGVISESTFSRNHIVGGVGLLVFGVGKCKLDCCNLTENSVCNTSLIGMFSTHLYLNLTFIERNYVIHDSRQALLFAINSVCEYTNTTIRYNHSPFSPLHQFEFRSCFGFWNCTFEENNHPELMLCDGTCEFNFTNTTVMNNMGSFLATSLNSSVSFNESWVENNFSGEMPLFDIPASQFIVFHPCVFRNNVGLSIVNLRGGKGRVDIREAKFIGNKVGGFVIAVDSKSLFYLTRSKFSGNFAESGSVFIEDSFTIINRSRFWNEHNFPLNILKGEARIDENSFRNNSMASLRAENVSLSMTGGKFHGKVAGGHLKLSGSLKLRGLKFSTGEHEAISEHLVRLCRECAFAESRTGFWQSRIAMVLLLFGALFLVAVFWTSGTDREHCSQPFQNTKEP